MSDARDAMPLASVPVYQVTGTGKDAIHASQAHRTLQPSVYGNDFNGVGYSGLISLLRDLRHLCDFTGVDFEACLTAATCEYETERRSDAKAPEPRIGDPKWRADFINRHPLLQATEKTQ